MSTQSEPTLFGLPLNRLVAFAGPCLAFVAGAIAAWLVAKANVLGFPGLGTHQHELATGITAGLTWLLVTVLTHLGHQKWLDGFQKWAYGQFIDQALPLELEPIKPLQLTGAAGGLDDFDDSLLPGDELPPEADGIEEADPSQIPPDEGDGQAGAAIADSPLRSVETIGPLTTSVSGLSYKNRIRARDLAMQAAFLGLKHAAALRYTQGGSRWEGIKRRLKAWKGDYPKHADCSAFATWCLWTGLSHFGVRDTVNGQNWQAGYTGTMVRHGKRVVHESNIMRGDLALYGNPTGGSGHVAICVGGGKVISFGSDAGPFLLPLHYRSDLREIRRYI